MDTLGPYITVLLTAVSGVWYFRNELRNELESLKKNTLEEVEHRFALREDFKVLETRVESILQSMARIEKMLEKIDSKT